MIPQLVLVVDTNIQVVLETKNDPKRKLYKQVCKVIAGKMKERNYTQVAKRLKIDKRTLKHHKMQKTARHGLALSEEDEEMFNNSI